MAAMLLLLLQALVVVLNITPQLTHLGTLCFLRGLFRRLVRNVG